MIDGKRAASGARRCIQGAQRRRGTGGRDKGKGAAHRGGGGYKGRRKRETGAGEKESKAQRGEKVRRGVVVWVQLLARAYIYSSYI